MKNLFRIGRPAPALALAALTYILLMNNARFALLPHVWIIHGLTGIPFAYVPDIGYLAAGQGFAITPDCMGAKFFVAAFLMLALGYPSPSPYWGARARTAAFYYASSLLGAVAVNVARILISLPVVGWEKGLLAHNLVSLLMYFGSLTLLNFYMQRRRYPHGTNVQSGEEAAVEPSAVLAGHGGASVAGGDWT